MTDKELAERFFKLYRWHRDHNSWEIVSEFLFDIIHPAGYKVAWERTTEHDLELNLLTHIVTECPEVREQLENLMFRMI